MDLVYAAEVLTVLHTHTYTHTCLRMLSLQVAKMLLTGKEVGLNFGVQQLRSVPGQDFAT